MRAVVRLGPTVSAGALPALRATRATRASLSHLAHGGVIHATPAGRVTTHGAAIAAHRRADESGASRRPSLETAGAAEGGSVLPATLVHGAGPVATAALPKHPARSGMGRSAPRPTAATCGAIVARVARTACGWTWALLAVALGLLRPRAASAGCAISMLSRLGSGSRRLRLLSLLHEPARRCTKPVDVNIARAARPHALLHRGPEPGDLGVARAASPFARLHALLYRPAQPGEVRGARTITGLAGPRAQPLLNRLALLDDLQTLGSIVGPVGSIMRRWSLADDGSPLLPVRRGTQ